MKMNPEVKAKWVAELRSGNYPQGTASLREGDKFCCLGVLSQLAVNEGLCSLQSTPNEHNDGVAHLYDDSEYLLPLSVIDWAELKDDDLYDFKVENPTIFLDDEDLVTLQAYPWNPMKSLKGEEAKYREVPLSRLNDIKVPFSIIADLIEKHM